MIKFFNKYKYQLLLIVVACLLFFVNYKSRAYLVGWDSLQTELNPGLAVKRAFFSVWEEYQSMGLTAGMAHAADLPRAVFLWLASYVVPQNMIRYFYHMLMLLIGGIGAMSLMGEMGLIGGIGLIGGLFYMLNLGTVQIFYLPFESFSTFFALLPWGVWIFIRVISNAVRNPEKRKDAAFGLDSSSSSTLQNDKRLWLLFVLINILGVPAFYTQQLFIVYMLVLGCVAIGLIGRIGPMGKIKKIILAFSLILVINSFWLLPQLYFLKTTGRVVSEAKANQIATEDVFYQNYEKGTLDNFFRLEGFYFDLKGVHNTYLFAPWRDHFANPIAKATAYGIGVIGLIGLIGLIRKKKNIGFVLVYILCATALLLATPPFSWINELLRKISIVNQIFRSPFTKFIVPYSLIYSLTFAVGIDLFIKKIRHNKFIKNAFFYVFFVVIVFYSLPAFRGYFFSPEMKVTIPYDYSYVMNYFKTVDKNSRIAMLPDYTYWGWFFNTWGYNGSGFLWYGIEQPIVSRTFDVWSKASESYFWESKTAFEEEDINKIENVLEKYQVDYILLDKSLIPVVSNYKALQYDRINTLLRKSNNFFLVYSGEDVSLYKINHRSYSSNFVSLAGNLNSVGPKTEITNDDQALAVNGFYTSADKPKIYYPFLGLTSQTNYRDSNWKISEDLNYFYLSTPLNINANEYDFSLGNFYHETLIVNNQPVNVSLKLQQKIENNVLTIKIDKVPLENFNTGIDQKTNFGFTDMNIPQNIGYIVRTISNNSGGPPLFFYIEDETKQQSYLEDRLDSSVNYFILPPRYQYGLGYNFAFQNKSYSNLPASNQLTGLTLYLFPYNILKDSKFVKKNSKNLEADFSADFTSKKINYFTYSVNLKNRLTEHSNNLILYQAYDSGWMAISGGKFLPHVRINNWANGWILQPGDNQATLIFWPQYLEFAGFGLLIIALIILLKGNGS